MKFNGFRALVSLFIPLLLTVLACGQATPTTVAAPTKTNTPCPVRICGKPTATFTLTLTPSLTPVPDCNIRMSPSDASVLPGAGLQTFSWTAVPNATAYSVHFSQLDGSNGFDMQVPAGYPSATSVKHELSVLPGGGWRWTVTAVLGSFGVASCQSSSRFVKLAYATPTNDKSNPKPPSP